MNADPVAEDASPRQRILDAARVLLAHRGFAGVTMRNVGSAVGLHNTTLFHHFSGKQEIVAAVVARESDELLERLSVLNSDDPPSLERFVALFGELSDYYAHRPESAQIAMRLFLDPDDLLGPYAKEIDQGQPDHSNRLVRFADTMWGWLGRAAAAGAIRPIHPPQATRNLLGILLMDGVWTSGLPGADSSPKKRREELAAFVRGALAPEKA